MSGTEGKSSWSDDDDESTMNNNKTTSSPPIRISTLIFDVDDTLYDVGTGFTAYRNGPCVQQFMVDRLNFPSLQAAKEVRDEYFARYHASAKGLAIAEQEGRFPPVPLPTAAQGPQAAAAASVTKSPRFDTQDLSEYWAEHMPFELLGDPKVDLARDLKDCPLQLVAFSNGPRKYVQRVLQALGLEHVFGNDDRLLLFAVDDVLPYCKPEKEAFDLVLKRIGVTSYEECVLVEDSMKNVKMAKELGMRTILVTGKGRLSNNSDHNQNGGEAAAAAAARAAAEETKAGDAPVHTDPAVDLAVETVEELRFMAPGLWSTPASFP